MPRLRLRARERRIGGEFSYHLGGAERADAHGRFGVVMQAGVTYWATQKDAEMLTDGMPGTLDVDDTPVARTAGDPIAVLNLPAAAWGDALLMFRAIDLWHARTGIPVTGFFSPLARRVIPLARRRASIGALGPVPVPFSELHAYPTVVDFDGLWSTAQEIEPPLDRMLRRCGMDPATVPAAEKVPTWRWGTPPDPLLVQSVRACRRVGKPLLLLAPKSSQHTRTMPRPFLTKLLPVLAQAFLVLHTDPDLPQDPIHGVVRLAVATEAIDDFAWLVSQADIVLSVDTLAYHLAAALEIPALVGFTTIEPRHRIRDYPTCEAFTVGPFVGANVSLDPSLPPAAHDQLYAAWCATDPYAIATQLVSLLARQVPHGEDRRPGLPA